MKTLEQFSSGLSSVPFYTASLLEDLAEMKGRQELFTRQSPQKLDRLRESAIIESALASNRMEGVDIDRARIAPLLKKGSAARDRNEEDVRNYQSALQGLHQGDLQSESLLTLATTLHGVIHEGHWDAGTFKEKDGEIIEKLDGGGARVRFVPVPASETQAAMAQADALYANLLKERQVSPLISLVAYNLDFLCIHPFRDGNGRVSRLLLLDGMYRLGFEAGRYISVERLIESSKDRYYETLEQSSSSWHEGSHDPWPYINYILFTFKEAYQEMESRLGDMKAPYGEKTQLVMAAIEQLGDTFTRSDIEQACPGVSVDMIKTVMTNLRDEGRLVPSRRGPKAGWKKVGVW